MTIMHDKAVFVLFCFFFLSIFMNSTDVLFFEQHSSTTDLANGVIIFGLLGDRKSLLELDLPFFIQHM